ncbi:MAG: aldolase/citrate lyase family protein [Chloroflexi bacterium]|nr:aldolase/citrate lyase family protein [Chloroflexota bacterium]MDA1146762.1 aldolase/citrate lyase family protein [Chloroflexota bacterium]MQC82868.1 hypothetical protein [Chloroflexota bacterium]
MLPLRSLLVVPASDQEALLAARRTGADAVVLDVAVPAHDTDRGEARANLAEAIDAIGATGRTVMVRVSSVSSGALAADLLAAVRPALAAVIVAGTEVPQDARDADVLLRKFELAHEITPGAVRLIPEIDSAAGLQALPVIAEAVDRYAAIALNAGRMHRDLGLARGRHDALDYVMALTAVTARAAELPWIVGTFEADRGFIEAARAHEFGAAGVTVQSEAGVRGVHSLFQPDAADVASARAVLREWERLRGDGMTSGVALIGDEGNPRVEPVDRRAMRAARLVVARADAIAARDQISD